MTKKKIKTKKQEKIAKKILTEEDPAISQERMRLLSQLKFLGDWAGVLERQLNGYKDTITMIRQKQQELYSTVQSLGASNEHIQKMETKPKG